MKSSDSGSGRNSAGKVGPLNVSGFALSPHTCKSNWPFMSSSEYQELGEKFSRTLRFESVQKGANNRLPKDSKSAVLNTVTSRVRFPTMLFPSVPFTVKR